MVSRGRMHFNQRNCVLGQLCSLLCFLYLSGLRVLPFHGSIFAPWCLGSLQVPHRFVLQLLSFLLSTSSACFSCLFL